MILELPLHQHFRIWPKAKRRNGRLSLQTGTWHITKYFRPDVFCETFTQQYLGACLCQAYMEQWMADRGWVMDMNSFMVRFILFLIILCPENGDVVVYRSLNHCQRVTPREKNGWTLAQVPACFLRASSLYLIQIWLFIKCALFRDIQLRNFTRRANWLNPLYVLADRTCEIIIASPKDQWHIVTLFIRMIYTQRITGKACFTQLKLEGITRGVMITFRGDTIPWQRFTLS